MTNRSCIICGEEPSEQTTHIELPCWNHWVCTDDLADFFVRATENESLYPPRCCDAILLLDEFEQYIPQDTQVAFMMKEQGEYQILQKYRVYCADTSCAKFLSPAGHIKDSDVNITYSICEGSDCGKATCVICKALLNDGIQGHTCEVPEHERKFKETAQQQGYKECFTCGATVELAEACNHITCECGSSFCYVCGKEWPGLHGCPQYGPANYDEDGYNQEGYHRDTERNRDSLTRLEQMQRDRGEEIDDEEDDEEREEREEDMPDWDVLQHLDAENRAVINSLPREERHETLQMIRIELMETRGITFNAPQHNEDDDDNDDSEDGDRDEEEREDENPREELGREEEGREQDNVDQGTQDLPHVDGEMQETAGEGNGAVMDQHGEQMSRADDLFVDDQPEFDQPEEDRMDFSDTGSDTGIPTAPFAASVPAFGSDSEDVQHDHMDTTSGSSSEADSSGALPATPLDDTEAMDGEDKWFASPEAATQGNLPW
ncbi:hypothetical protein K458DRAFT_400451 [Lentithecium fluviatile CBS 122367]|uniref:RBR-type E3 ubiquitin transferase n=1 Tax=Lentithecium fluviatile CBS 122367 TaxID=1168545 RepID=A0A6G1JHW5_9PLEO|nr:hypothetical protein K458DRAFT_400451 [Lentithecium fluviatile CBS 122367]